MFFLRRKAKKATAVVPVVKTGTGEFTYHDSVFAECRNGIEAIVQKHRPSGSNGRLPAMLREISEFLRKQNVNEESYWNDVYLRSPRKPSTPVRKSGGDLWKEAAGEETAPAA